jgi:hypothetical protein
MTLVEIISELFDYAKHALDIKHSHGGRGTRNINLEMWARQAYERNIQLNNSKLIVED